MSLESDYRDLLIIQYWNQPRARAEIEMKAASWSRILDWLKSFPEEFDLDNATGDRLDIIGRIVGISRTIPLIIPKKAFGFDDNPSSTGFDDKFSPVVGVAPFQDRFEAAYTDLQLGDSQYRTFIRAKIAKNIGSPYLLDDDGLSIQEVVRQIFSGAAYVIDNQNMTLSLYVESGFDTDTLNAIVSLNLLPKPHGVRWIYFVQPEVTFGFSDNPESAGFANKFDLVGEPGAPFAEKVLI